eukprot:c23887_g2_i1 orf=135-1211(+)
MEDEDCSKLSPELDLNQAVSNDNDEEVKGELEKDQAQKSRQQESDEGRVSSVDADEAPPIEEPITFPKELPGAEDEALRLPEKQPASDDVAGNGADETLPLHARDDSRSRSPSPGKSAPAKNTSRASSPLTRESSSPAKQTSSPVPRSKRSHGSVERSRSPSPKKRRASAGGRRSLSRSPEGRHGRRSASRSPEGRHGKRRDDGKKRHDRSRSPVGRSQRRERSRSWSPYERERDRRSRHSPRRRSPPPRYSSKGDRSPRKRPWSPPRNRNTGVGKPGNHLFVAGFSFATTERDLEKKFGRYGRVTDVRIIRDRRSGDSRGFGFLSLERDEEADDAIKGLDQTEWNGRIVLVEKAKTN